MAASKVFGVLRDFAVKHPLSTKVSGVLRDFAVKHPLSTKVSGVLRGFAVKRPLTTAFLLASPLFHFYLQNRAYRMKIKRIDDMLEAGTKPHLLTRSSFYIDRSDIIDRIRKSFVAVPDEEYKGFGVILGPTGTGKTDATRKACNGKQTSGVLYCEVKSSKFLAEDLAETIGISLEPMGLIGLGLSYLSDRYCHYYTLPDDSTKATIFVLGILAKRAKKYKKKHGHVPCLFIDGIDLVAKHDRHAFIELVELAKLYANRTELRIIFVSSEGHIVPLMETTSSSSRKKNVVEVLDVSDGDAKKYLTNKGMPENLASRVVEMTGGRMIHLIQAINTYSVYSTLGEDGRMKEIEEFLYAENVRRPLLSLKLQSTLGEKIVKYLLSNGDTSPLVLTEVLEDNDEAVLKTIESLVQANLLRYTAKGLLGWHSPLVHNAVLTRMKK